MTPRTIYGEDGEAYELIDEGEVISQHYAQREAAAEAQLRQAEEIVNSAEQIAGRRLTNREIDKVVLNYWEGGIDAAADVVSTLPNLDDDETRRDHLAERLEDAREPDRGGFLIPEDGTDNGGGDYSDEGEYDDGEEEG